MLCCSYSSQHARVKANPIGKVRRAIKGFINEFPEYERLLPHVKGSSFSIYMRS